MDAEDPAGADLAAWLDAVTQPPRQWVRISGLDWQVGEIVLMTERETAGWPWGEIVELGPIEPDPAWPDGFSRRALVQEWPQPTRLASEYTTDVWVEAE